MISVLCVCVIFILLFFFFLCTELVVVVLIADLLVGHPEKDVFVLAVCVAMVKCYMCLLVQYVFPVDLE